MSAAGEPEVASEQHVESSTRMDRVWHALTHRHPDPDDPGQMRAQERLSAYENKTAWAMVTLAIVYLILYSVFVLEPDLPSEQRSWLNIGMNTIWVVFIVDLTIRALLAPRFFAYLVHHPIDVIAVAIPALRVLRVLRVLTAGQWLISRGSRLRFGRTATAVALAAVFMTYLSALAVLNAERGAAQANIESFPEALWWSIVTMSTVGYGEYYPVTSDGRIVATGVMIFGISLLGLVGASVASSVIARLSGKAREGQDEVKSQIIALTCEVAALRQQLTDAGLLTHSVPSADRSDDRHVRSPSDPDAS